MKKISKNLLIVMLLGLSACSDKQDDSYQDQWMSSSITARNDIAMAQVLVCRTTDEVLGSSLRTYYSVYVPKEELIAQLNKGDFDTTGYTYQDAIVEFGEAKLGSNGGSYRPQKRFDAHLRIYSQFSRTKSFEITNALNELSSSDPAQDFGILLIQDSDNQILEVRSDSTFFPSEMECKNTNWERLNIINYHK